MFRKALSLSVLLLCVLSAGAANPLSKKGYVGSVTVAATPQLSLCVDLTTSHGYSFGGGLWMGAGLGVSHAGDYDGIFIPIYTEAKYAFLNVGAKTNPFIGCRVGYMYNGDHCFTLISPSAGIDIGRFSIFSQYCAWADVRTANVGVSVSF